MNDYSVFNLWNANTLTTIPVCAFDPVGPPIGFALYHNSASANDDDSGVDGQGFTLGRGWSTSYSGRLVFNSGSSTTVIEDDGTQNTYTLVSAFWTPPTGVHDRLSYDDATDPNHPVWILTRPSQYKRIFNAAGLLIEERDSIGNAAKIIRDPVNGYRITAIRSAAHGLPDGFGTLTHQITLGYTSDQLTSITDVLGRVWTLAYYSAGADTGRLRYLHYPHSDIPASFMEFDYHPSSGRINGLHQRRQTSENDVFWEYDYSAGILEELIDPGQGAPDPNNPYSTGQHGFTVIGGTTTYRREITDRRGELWTHIFNSTGNRIKTIDPLSEEREFAYDSDRNVTSYTDELEHAWTYTYGPVGNVETVISPLDTGDPNHPQSWTLDWNAVGTPGVTNFYQLTKVTNPAGKWVEYEYAGSDAEEPLSTLPIRIIQLPDGCGNPNNVIELQYYTGATSEAHAYGQLWRATDANGVITQFEYDRWGYLAWLTEGLFLSSTTGTAGCIPVEGGPGGAAGPMPGGGSNNHPGAGNDPAGRPNGGADDNGSCASLDWNDNDNLAGAACPCILLDLSPTRLGTVGAPSLGATPQSFNAQYNAIGLPVAIERNQPPVTGTSQLDQNRAYMFSYDCAQRAQTIVIGSNDPNSPSALARNLSYDSFDAENRLLSRTAPDGSQTVYSYDSIGRLHSITQGSGQESMTSTLTYDVAGRLTLVQNCNGTATEYQYDAVDRLQSITHSNAELPFFTIEYSWTIDNLVSSRRETWSTGSIFTDFEYDRRDHLIRETRLVDNDGIATCTADVHYSYDQLGNRLKQIDNAAQCEIEFVYDTDYSPETLPSPYNAFPTHHNRLLEYTVYDTTPTPRRALRTVRYTYYKTGQASNITVRDFWHSQAPGDPDDYSWSYDLALYYWGNGALRYALLGRWLTDAYPPADYYEALSAKEFRFDGPSARYLATNLNTNNSVSSNQWTLDGPLHWTDYDGQEPLSDWNLVDLDLGNGFEWGYFPLARYFGGEGNVTLDDFGAVVERTYWHNDMLGSVVARTGATGQTSERRSYSAFGVALDESGATISDPTTSRYQFVGSYGYETNHITLQGANRELTPITLQHLGHRWYDPAIGRFVQRDPIGIEGGLNVYEYVQNQPLTRIDPSGTTEMDPDKFIKAVEKAMKEVLKLREFRPLKPDALKALKHLQNLRNVLHKIRNTGAPMLAFCVIAAEAGQALQDHVIDPAIKRGQEKARQWIERMRDAVGGYRARGTGLSPDDLAGWY